jgi:uncharacterized membrane protein YtjA (UPF0391 family)
MMKGLIALFVIVVLLSALLGITGIPAELATVLAAVAIIVWFVAVTWGEEGEWESD